MISETLNLWGNGAVTLPKQWRDQFPTKHFMAKETPEGLLIKPILDIEYYENKDGSFGLRFPMGIGAGDLLKMVRQANDEIEEEEKAFKKKKRRSAKRHG